LLINRTLGGAQRPARISRIEPHRPEIELAIIKGLGYQGCVLAFQMPEIKHPLCKCGRVGGQEKNK